MHTPQMVEIAWGFFLIWACLAGIMLFRCVKAWVRLQIVLRRCLPGELWQLECLRKVCLELGIRENRVRLKSSYGTAVPFITGLVHPTVVLPVDEYKETTLRIILYHELTHYLHRDLWLKGVATLIFIFHCWNPVVWWYQAIIQRWGEYACDYEVCNRMGGMRLYFETIQACVMRANRINNFLGTHLFEDKHELLRRVNRMAKYREIKVKTKVQMGLASALLLITSTVSVYGASATAAEGYVNLYEATAVEAQEAATDENELVEYVETDVNPNLVEEIGETTNDVARAAVHFDWTVPTDYIKKTSTFSASSGGRISVTAYIDPTDKTVKVGIIEPDGTRRYVLGKDVVSHTFSLDETGSYRVYIQNETGTTVYASGMYSVR